MKQTEIRIKTQTIKNKKCDINVCESQSRPQNDPLNFYIGTTEMRGVHKIRTKIQYYNMLKRNRAAVQANDLLLAKQKQYHSSDFRGKVLRLMQ